MRYRIIEIQVIGSTGYAKVMVAGTGEEITVILDPQTEMCEVHREISREVDKVLKGVEE